MNSWREGWFTEMGVLNSDAVTLNIKADKILYQARSKFQEIIVFESNLFGRCLVLDDAVQCTEKDEFSYQEMMSFIPLNAHPNPESVLIIGGGDGGVAREVVKHPKVKKVVQCEIDEEVVRVSREYLPFMSVGFDSEKVDLHIEDGYEFVKNHPGEFDVIITDSSDPKGPAEVLFQKPYYEALNDALKPSGIICCQAESYWFDLELIKKLMKVNREIFPNVAYASTAVPSYPSGQIGFLIASKDENLNLADPVTRFSDEETAAMNLRYYSLENHNSSFVLPVFVQKAINDA